MFRFAIAPTKDMDMDNLHVAILNYIISQQRQDNFTIRIEDIDKDEMIEGKDTEIMQILEKFALKYTSVSHQSEKKHIHQTLAIRLLEEGKAFICTCESQCSGECFHRDKDELTNIKKSAHTFSIAIKDENDHKDSFVILRKDTTPSYVFAAACDDMLNNIDCIVAKENFRSYQERQESIKNLLGYQEKTEYLYIPAINTKDNKQYTLQWLFEEGYIPDAMINHILLLGYQDAPKEVFTLPEAIEWFRFDALSKESAIFDIEKLRFLNQEHLKRLDDKLLSTIFEFADADIGKLAKLYIENGAATLKELKSKIELIFTPKKFQGKWQSQMRTLETHILEAPIFNDYNDFIAYLMDKSQLEESAFFIPLRVLLTGVEYGPELSDIYPLIKSYILEIAS